MTESHPCSTTSKWDSSKKIVVHINGNASSNNDEKREASDADIESWYGLICLGCLEYFGRFLKAFSKRTTG